MPTTTARTDPFNAWIRGWAIARDVAPPTPHADGWHIAVGLPRHAARYVFERPSPTLRDLGATIAAPWVFLKAGAIADELRALLPASWELQPDGFMMTCGDTPFRARTDLPPGYSLRVDDTAARTRRAHVQVRAPAGGVAAEGHLALDDAFAIYDRIITEPDHRRSGLGQVVMRALQAVALAHGRHAGVLVATPEGRALYQSIGWRLHGPWATAVIPGADATT